LGLGEDAKSSFALLNLYGWVAKVYKRNSFMKSFTLSYGNSDQGDVTDLPAVAWTQVL